MKNVIFNTFTMLYNYHFYLVPKHCHHHKMEPPTNDVVTPPFPFPQPLETTSLLFVFIDFPILDISYRQNHPVCELWCLASFNCNVVVSQTYYSINSCLHCCMISYCVNIPQFICLSTGRYSDCFHFWALKIALLSTWTWL